MGYEAYESELNDVWVLEPKVHGDSRGYFYESFNKKDFELFTSLKVNFVQDNHSKSKKNVLRGLHYQIKKPQGKLIRVIEGEIFDVAVDVRLGSPNFGYWFGIHLSENNKKQLWIPPGFAHGFLVVSEVAQVLYKTTDFYYPAHEKCILWNDKELGIKWPLNDKIPTLSDKDINGLSLISASLPRYKN